MKILTQSLDTNLVGSRATQKLFEMRNKENLDRPILRTVVTMPS